MSYLGKTREHCVNPRFWGILFATGFCMVFAVEEHYTFKAMKKKGKQVCGKLSSFTLGFSECVKTIKKELLQFMVKSKEYSKDKS